MANVKLRCLTVGCNPKISAESVEGKPLSEWQGNSALKAHAIAFPHHRIALAPVRSAEGRLKQKIRNSTGVYPLELSAEQRAELEAAEARSSMTTEELAAESLAKSEAKATRKADARKAQLVAAARRELAEREAREQRERELSEARATRRVLVDSLSPYWKLDGGFLEAAVDNPELGNKLFRAIRELKDYGEGFLSSNLEDYGIYVERLKAFIESPEWESATIRRSTDVADSYTEEEMAERRKLIREWEALCARGEKEGWLAWTNDYAGSELYGVEDTRHPSRRVPELELASSYADRLSKLVAKTHRTLASELGELDRARGLLRSYRS